jgi:ubiquinone/menaquinone biosynthesis C-methylase UbiE
MDNNNFFLQKRQFFDNWAFHYDVLFTTIFYQAVHKRLLEFVTLGKNAKVLDIGCGTGRLLNRILSTFPTVSGIGVDLSPNMLRQARKNKLYREREIFVQGNAENLPFAENQFDGVFNTISFLHYPNPEKVFKEIHRILAPQGYYYLADYSRYFNQDYIPFSPGGINFYTTQQREKMGENADLKVVSHHYLINNVILTIFSKP